MLELPAIPDAQAPTTPAVPAARRRVEQDVERWQKEIDAASSGQVGLPPAPANDTKTAEATLPSLRSAIEGDLGDLLGANSPESGLAELFAARFDSPSLGKSARAEFRAVLSQIAHVRLPQAVGAAAQGEATTLGPSVPIPETPEPVAPTPGLPARGTAPVDGDRVPLTPTLDRPFDPLLATDEPIATRAGKDGALSEPSVSVSDHDKAAPGEGPAPAREAPIPSVEPERPTRRADVIPGIGDRAPKDPAERTTTHERIGNTLEEIPPTDGVPEPEIPQPALPATREGAGAGASVQDREPAFSTARPDRDERIRTRERRVRNSEEPVALPDSRAPIPRRTGEASFGSFESPEGRDARQHAAGDGAPRGAQLSTVDSLRAANSPVDSPSANLDASAGAPSQAVSIGESASPLLAAETVKAGPALPAAPSTIDGSYGSPAPSSHSAEPAIETVAKIHHSALADSILARARALPANGALEVRFGLEPEDLGPVLVRIESQGDQLKIRILASSGAAVEALSAGLSRLTAGLTEPGTRAPQIDLRFDDSLNPHTPQGRGDSSPQERPRHDTRGDRAAIYHIEASILAAPPRTSRLDRTA